ncbi:hypothetical protein C8R45DRAFT_1185017, partial [Mycena sanguinolenta]
DTLSAQDFLRAFHRDTRASTPSADKAKAFKNYLVAGSEVDIWYKGLPAATKADMDLLDAAIELRYPAQDTVQPTEVEYGVMLVKEKIRMEDLGTKVKVAERDVWAHLAWANKMQRLATSAGVAATATYIEQVRVELPRQLRTKVGRTFTDWSAFIKAVRDVDAVELEMEMKEWREEEEEKKKMARMLASRQPPTSPTAGLRNQLANTSLGGHAGAPRWPAPAAQGNPFGAGGGGRGNLFGGPQQQPAFQLRQPMERQQPLQGAERAKLLKGIGRIPHHPDTDAGRRAHADQQQAWFAAHGNVVVTVSTPYPLRPGRAPLNTGECYRCGISGHTNYQRGCNAPQEQCLNPREQAWRRIASQALREPALARRAGKSLGAVQREARTAPEEQKKEPEVLGRDEPTPEDMRTGPQIRRNTLMSTYATSKSHVVDLYTVGMGKNGAKQASVPFVCEIEAEGPKGELVKIRASVDDGAMVNAMCTEMYEGVKSRMGRLQRSGRTLRMANGAEVSSRGYWAGYVRLGGVRQWTSFEIFPSGGSWSFLFGKPLLEQYAATHDYVADVIQIQDDKGTAVEIANGLTRLGTWDAARGRVASVFLDPKSRRMITGESNAYPARRTIPCSDKLATIVEEEEDDEWRMTAGSMGDLSTPAGGVLREDEEAKDEDTDEIWFTAPEWTEDEMIEREVH